MGRATEYPILIITKTASGAITRKRFVKSEGAQATVAGERVQGVSRDGAADGAPVPVTIMGTALVTAGQPVQAYQKVMTAADGKVIPAQKGKFIAGEAQSAGGAGEDIEVLLQIGSLAAGATTTTTTSSTTTTTTAP